MRRSFHASVWLKRTTLGAITLVLSGAALQAHAQAPAPGRDRLTINDYLDWETVGNPQFSPDGKHVLSGGQDHTVRLWDVATGKEQKRYEGQKDRVRWVAAGYARILNPTPRWLRHRSQH